MGLKEVEKQSQSFLAIPSEAVGGSGGEKPKSMQGEAQENQVQLLNLVSHS